MTQLPPALRPWQPTLASLAPDVAPGLADWLRRLDSFLEPAGRPANTPEGEPDGFDGLDRRGPLVRLRSSEWALAETLTLEFQRRLAMAELLYLRPCFREPRRTTRVFLLFDSGPDQLGLPRLVHLALLLLFQSKVKARGAVLQWGCLQSDQLTEAVAPLAEAEVRGLLESRSLSRPDPDSVSTLLAKVPFDPALDEVWIVGGPATHALVIPPIAPHLLQIDEPVEDLGATVRLTLQSRRGAVPRHLRLPRPADPLPARCLRNPFPKAASAAFTEASSGALVPHPETGLTLPEEGRHVLLRLADGGLLALHIPNSANAPAVQPVIFQADADESIIAATWRSKRLWVATKTESGFLRTYTVGRKAERRFVKVYGLESPHRFAPVPTCAIPLLALDPNARDELGLVLDGNGVPFRRSQADGKSGQPPLTRVTDTPNAALGGWALAAIAAESADARTAFAVHVLNGKVGPTMTVPVPDRIERLMCGTLSHSPLSEAHVVTGVETVNRRLLLFDGKTLIDEQTLGPGEHAVGLLALWQRERLFGFVVLGADQRTVRFLSSRLTKQLLQTYAPVSAVSASLHSGHVAALTSSGSLSVYAVGRDAVVFRHDFSSVKGPDHAARPP